MDLRFTRILLYGHVKNIVCLKKILNLAHLTQISAAAAVSSVMPDVLQRNLAEVDHRLDVCRATYGAHIKTYLGTKRLFLIVFQTKSTNFFTSCGYLKYDF